MVFRKLRSLFAKKHFEREGKGKNVFTARRVRKREKMILDANGKKRYAEGSHGKTFDLLVFKGKHRANLVVKEYHYGDQTKQAENEFALFNRLKSHNFSVPPTVRLVEIDGKKYVALTDISRFGQIQTKGYDDIRSIMGEKKGNEIIEFIEKEKQRAANLHIYLNDCWEFAIDPEKKTCKAFILDLGKCREY